MKNFLLEIITPERTVFSRRVDGVFAYTRDGTIGVLANHMRLFTSLTEGEVKIVENKKEYFLAIGGGFMEVNPDKTVILVSRAYQAHELNEKEIKKAQQQAKDALKNKAVGIERAQALSILRRSMIEMKVLRRRKRSRERLQSSV